MRTYLLITFDIIHKIKKTRAIYFFSTLKHFKHVEKIQFLRVVWCK
jgi:hypothetical protein